MAKPNDFHLANALFMRVLLSCWVAPDVIPNGIWAGRKKETSQTAEISEIYEFSSLWISVQTKKRQGQCVSHWNVVLGKLKLWIVVALVVIVLLQCLPFLLSLDGLSCSSFGSAVAGQRNAQKASPGQEEEELVKCFSVSVCHKLCQLLHVMPNLNVNLLCSVAQLARKRWRNMQHLRGKCSTWQLSWATLIAHSINKCHIHTHLSLIAFKRLCEYECY